MESLRKEKNLRRFQEAGLYLVITEEFTSGRGSLRTLQEAADAGIRLVQLREKSLCCKELYYRAEEFKKICEKYDILMMMNDHIDIALAVGADGVHLGQDDLPLEAALRLAPELLIGRSTHSREEALSEQAAGASVINLGPIYTTQTKSLPMSACGLELIDQTINDLHIPFSVMGGIKAHHIGELVAHGAKTIAMVTEITQAENIGKRIKELFALMGK